MKHFTRIFAFALALFASSAFADNLTFSSPGLAPSAEKGFYIIGTKSIASIAVDTASTGYTAPPTITFTGGGTGQGATATAKLKVVGTVTITAGGTGYTNGDVLTVVGGTKTTAAVVTVSSVSSGAVTAATITTAGSYSVIPANAASVTGGTGTGATVTLTYGVASIAVTDGGRGFTSAPTVVFSSGSAAATVTLAALPLEDVKFRAIIPLSSTVIDTLTVPTKTSVGSYGGDDTLEGVTLAAGVTYPVYGNQIKLTSGLALLILR